MTFAANSAPEPYRTIIVELEERIQHEIKVGCEAEEENLRLRAALGDMIEITKRNSEASMMLIAIRKCAEHALTAA
jgi:hypothetical protein